VQSYELIKNIFKSLTEKDGKRSNCNSNIRINRFARKESLSIPPETGKKCSCPAPY